MTNNRGSKVLVTFLIVIIGILAISTGYLFAKNSSLQKTSNSQDASQDDIVKPTATKSVEATPTVTASVTATSTPTPTSTKTTTATPTPTSTKTTAVTGEKYTVKAGDTMYSIALKYNVNWIKLAEANGLTEQTANNIKVGQVLVIPSK